MYRLTTIHLLVLAVFLLSLSSCNRNDNKKNVETLNNNIIYYGVALRWANYRDAYEYHRSADGSQPEIDIDRLKEYSVTGFKVVQKIINDSLDEALIESEISFYNKNQATVKQITLKQVWWFEEESKRWFIDEDFPDIK